MKAYISFSEIQSLIQLKTKQEIAFTATSEQSLKIETKIKKKLPLIGEIGKTVGMEVTVERIVGNDIYLKYEGGLGIDMIIKGLLTFVTAISTQKIIEKEQDNALVVHLDQIEQAQKALEMFKLSAIKFQLEGIEAEVRFKLNEK